jgi:hypothetical protein
MGVSASYRADQQTDGNLGYSGYMAGVEYC